MRRDVALSGEGRDLLFKLRPPIGQRAEASTVFLHGELLGLIELIQPIVFGLEAREFLRGKRYQVFLFAKLLVPRF